ncbi:hypothetical protein MPER_12957 [Moniliophthora perniciosa FA553]|nr:hypothetical protein MPER_12957 [Moniliophthora perniciosa FA553]
MAHEADQSRWLTAVVLLLKQYVGVLPWWMRPVLDLYSYNMEQSKGHSGANIMTVLMKAKQCGIQEASDYVGALCGKLVPTRC